MSDVRDSGEFASPAPTRWLDDAEGASDLERDLLRSGLDVRPNAEAKAQIWAVLAGKIGPGGGGSGGGSAAAAKGATAASAVGSGGLVTSALIGAACAVAVLAGGAALEARSHPTPPSASAARTLVAPPPQNRAFAAASSAPPAIAPAPDTPPPSIAPAPLKPGDSARPSSSDAPQETAPVAIEALPSSDSASSGNDGANPGAGGAAAVADRVSRLREESRLLSEARAALRSGDFGGCFSRLESARTQFPTGVLGQEREALTIEALATSGNRALAKERAAAFLNAYPNSPHASRVRTFAQ